MINSMVNTTYSNWEQYNLDDSTEQILARLQLYVSDFTKHIVPIKQSFSSKISS